MLISIAQKARLAIELDGSQHYDPEQKAKDAVRTSQIEEMNVKVIRFANNDTDKNFRGICEYIDMIVTQCTPK